MEYVLILTLSFSIDGAHNGQGGGGGGIAMQGFNNLKACAEAGELWVKTNKLFMESSGNSGVYNNTNVNYLCTPKGE